MKKRTEDLVVAVLAIPVIFLSKLFCVVLLIVALYVSGFLAAQVKRNQIRGDIFSYVQEHKDSIDLKSMEYSQEFVYADDGFGDAGIIYGYVYTPVDLTTDRWEEYRGGFRRDGQTRYGDGWIFFEEICDNWYYFEEHYG